MIITADLHSVVQVCGNRALMAEQES